MILAQEITHSPSHALAAKLIKEINGGQLKPGEKLAGLRETAQRHKVSLATVRHSFKLLAKEGFVISQHGSGTFVNPAMKFKGTKLVGLLTSYHKQDIEGYFEPLFEVANSFDALPMVCTLEDYDSWPDMVRKMTDRDPDLLLIDVEAKDVPVGEFIKAVSDTPHCFINRWEWHGVKPEHAVLVDYVSAYVKALKTLVQKDHGRILFAAHHHKPRPYLIERIAAAAKSAGLHFPSQELEYIGLYDRADKEIKPESPELRRIFEDSSEAPTAILAISDYVGFYFQQLVNRMKPKLGSIETIGFFDTKWSKQQGHEFSTFAIDYADMWRRAFSNMKSGSGNGRSVQWSVPKFVAR